MVDYITCLLYESYNFSTKRANHKKFHGIFIAYIRFARFNLFNIKSNFTRYIYIYIYINTYAYIVTLCTHGVDQLNINTQR